MLSVFRGDVGLDDNVGVDRMRACGAGKLRQCAIAAGLRILR